MSRHRIPEERSQDYPQDFTLDEAKQRAFDGLDSRGSTFHIHHPPKRDPVTVGLAIFAIVAQVALWVWWGGRMSQRVDQLEYQQQETVRLLAANNERDNRQDITQGIIGQQYGDIGRRLDSIERKLDRR